MTKLNLQLIEKFAEENNMSKSIWTPDWDDRGYTFTLNSGIDINVLFVCNSTPCDSDMMEGLDGWICIQTLEELEKFNSMDYNETLQYIAEENKGNGFKIEDYYEE